MAARKARPRSKTSAKKPPARATEGAKSKPKQTAKSDPSPLDLVEERVKKFGLLSLSEAEQDVYVLSDLQFQVTCGGYLYNRFDASGDDAWRGRDILVAVHALRRAGQARYAELLDRALRILLRPVAVPVDTWGGFIDSVDPNGEIDAMEGEMTELNDALWELVQSAAEAVARRTS